MVYSGQKTSQACSQCGLYKRSSKFPSHQLGKKRVVEERERAMNNLSNATLTEHQKQRRCWSVYSCKPIPSVALLVLVLLFLMGLGVSIFILIVVHNALFFIFFLFLSSLVAAFLLWNSRNAGLVFYLHSFPDSDLRFARDGDIVKITGVFSRTSFF